MTLNEATALFEKPFEQGPQGNHSRAATGEPYVEIVSGGVKPEGERGHCLCSTPELAVMLWFQAARAYAAATGASKLYWRRRPVLDEVQTLGAKYYVVYSRLLISDKPIIHAEWLPPLSQAA